MNNKKRVRILSIDGGGIRGVIPATILKYAEEYLQEKAPGTRLADHFDLIAGTSTGGILTCIYLTPDIEDPKKSRFSAEEALNFYREEGYRIFNASKVSNWVRFSGLLRATAYSPKHLEYLFNSRFGELKISELLKPCLITTYNVDSKSAFFFTSSEKQFKREYLVADVARSTSAAPTYFPPAKIKNIAPNAKEEGELTKMINLDGGVFANNPLMCAYAEARKTNFEERNNNQPTAQDMYILSLGTGGGGFDLNGKESIGSWNLLKWAKAIPDIMMDGSTDTVAFQMNEIFRAKKENDPGAYLRVDVPLKERQYSSDMANASPENIKKLEEAAQRTIEFARKEMNLDAFLDGLVEDEKLFVQDKKSAKAEV